MWTLLAVLALAAFLYWKKDGIVKLFNKRKKQVEDKIDDISDRFDGENDE